MTGGRHPTRDRGDQESEQAMDATNQVWDIAWDEEKQVGKCQMRNEANQTRVERDWMKQECNGMRVDGYGTTVWGNQPQSGAPASSKEKRCGKTRLRIVENWIGTEWSRTRNTGKWMRDAGIHAWIQYDRKKAEELQSVNKENQVSSGETIRRKWQRLGGNNVMVEG